MRTLKYSITKIIIYVVSSIIIFLLKTQVFAMSCDVSNVSPIHLSNGIQNNRTEVTQNQENRYIQVKITLNENPVVTKPNDIDYYDVIVPFSSSVSYFNATDNKVIGNTEVVSVWPSLATDSGWFFGTIENGYARFRLRDNRTLKQFVINYPVFLYFQSGYVSYNSITAITTVNDWGQVQYYKCDSQKDLEDKIDETNDKLKETKDYLEDDDTSSANSSASGFFNSFNNTDHGGLSGIVSAPMRLINALSSSSCSPLTFPLPFVNEQVTLPCMSPIYSQNFGAFLTLYRLITTGLIGYWVCIKLYGKVRAIKKPEDDRIEVLEL